MTALGLLLDLDLRKILKSLQNITVNRFKSHWTGFRKFIIPDVSMQMGGDRLMKYYRELRM